MVTFPSDHYGKTGGLEASRGQHTHSLPRRNFFMYVLQAFPDVLGDQLGWRDASISLEVCRFLQYIPIVVLTQQPPEPPEEKPGGRELTLLFAELQGSTTLLITA